MAAHLANILAAVLLPPFCFILIGGLGVVLWRRRPRLGRALAGVSFVLLWIMSMPAFNVPFLEALGWPAPADVRPSNGARAIVVLGAGINRGAPEYGGEDTINAGTLERLRYAARLFRQTNLPVLVSGGRPYSGAEPEAALMKDVLEKEFATPVRWVEDESANTFENARESARILRQASVDKAYLVTHSSHMRRAVEAFASTGIEVIPAAINIYSTDPVSYADFLPSPLGIRTNATIAHELLGRAWYAIRRRFG